MNWSGVKVNRHQNPSGLTLPPYMKDNGETFELSLGIEITLYNQIVALLFPESFIWRDSCLIGSDEKMAFQRSNTMTKHIEVKWLAEPEEKNFHAAGSYLDLICGKKKISAMAKLSSQMGITVCAQSIRSARMN